MVNYKEKYNKLVAAIVLVTTTEDHMVFDVRSDPPSKHDSCVHGNYGYEGCESCLCDYLQDALLECSTGDKHD